MLFVAGSKLTQKTEPGQKHKKMTTLIEENFERHFHPRWSAATAVFGEGEVAVILFRFSLHLILCLPSFIIACVSRVFKVDIPQVIS